ncbi:MAG TPA: TIGR01777 family oxidoreductase [Burkholderiales bacterium]|nr:TIGR01777 family oxidoreductase [Burkholderiales bacterium]
MTESFWWLVSLQMALGAFDTLYHHELTERLAWRPSQAGEVRLHGVRNLAYVVIFMALGWGWPQGAFAWGLIGLMAAEMLITGRDFVEEDRTRKLPATERVTHLLLTLNYGVVLGMLLPLLAQWAALPTALLPAYHGLWSWLCALAAAGVVVFGLRDLAAAGRAGRIVLADPAPLAGALAGRRAILVTGGTGFVGSRLIAALAGAGHEVTVLTRDRRRAAGLPVPLRVITSLGQIADGTRIDAIVNLAGEPISDGLWTRRKRFRILRSRLRMTRDLAGLMRRLRVRPEVLVSGSAVGWYGLRGDEALDETADGTPCFSRNVCVGWEREARAAGALGVRVVCLRTGLVLAAEGGMLSRMLVPFEFGLGGPFGNGRHWMSWIHRDDMVRLIVHAIATPALNGAVNATAPAPVRNREFTAALGRALARPAFMPAPAAPLRLALGAFAEELLLGGQKVLPEAAQRSGFRFDYPSIGQALDAIAGRRAVPAAARVQSSSSPEKKNSPAPIA